MVLIFTIVLLPSSAAHFRRFYGEVNAIAVILGAAAAGAAALWVLQSTYQFTLLKGRATLRGMALSAASATLLAVAIVIADFIVRYPQDLNVPMPQALLFYPAIGFVAEIVFHIVPLALVLLALKPFAGWMGEGRAVWGGILLVAVVEPTFQVLFLGSALTWADVYTWVHVFAIAVLQLVVFRRFDFASMYAFRLFYYAYWHILWGVIRLEVLF
jgi:hypothetical protein